MVGIITERDILKVCAGRQAKLEEIVVSARKVEETSQTVPISMSVLTEEKIQSINAFDFTEKQHCNNFLTNLLCK